MAEELAVEAGWVEKPYRLQSRLKQPGITLEEQGRENGNVCRASARFLFPEGKPSPTRATRSA